MTKNLFSGNLTSILSKKAPSNNAPLVNKWTAGEKMMDRRPDEPFERFFQLCPFVHETCEYVRLFMVDSAPILSPLSLSSSANNK